MRIYHFLNLSVICVLAFKPFKLAIKSTNLKSCTSFQLEMNLKSNIVPPIDILPLRFSKKTKQLATLGPASNTFEMIEKLFLSGADIFRLNFSHGEHSEKANIVKLIREVEKKYNHPICILGDLQGPKLRVGSFENDKVSLTNGQKFILDYKDEPGSIYRVRLPHPEILHTLKTGDVVLFDDGKLKMEVIESTIDSSDPSVGEVRCKVIVGGFLSNKKGVNTPSIVLPISPLTPKDRKDLAFILTLDIDWVALSFVQKPDDIAELKKLTGSKVKVMAKLEKPSAIGASLDAIVELSDGIMVARGDLGVEMNAWDVPIIQKRIVECCQKLGKPCVIATQMMESMIENPTPTRAEASDCATAVFDSADAVMLSAESAAGKFPVEAVTMQQKIITTIESDEVYISKLDRFAVDSGTNEVINSAITLAARQVADISKSKAILAFTSSGGTVMRVSRVRPKVPIIAACYEITIARKLAMVWGVYPILIEKPSTGVTLMYISFRLDLSEIIVILFHHGDFNLRDELIKACDEACSRGFCSPDTDLMTVTAGLPFGIPGTTNVIRIVSAKGPDYWREEGNMGSMRYYNSETLI